MKIRDLSAWETEGQALLEKHENFDLTTSEVHRLFDECHVTNENASLCFYVLNKAFALGVASGRRMTEFDSADILSDVSASLDKAQMLGLDILEDYFPMGQPYNIKQIECEHGRISIFLDILTDYLDKAQNQLTKLIG